MIKAKDEEGALLARINGNLAHLLCDECLKAIRERTDLQLPVSFSDEKLDWGTMSGGFNSSWWFAFGS
jgi:hypothetical protein